MTNRLLRTIGLVAVYVLLGLGAFAVWRSHHTEAVARPVQWRTYSEQVKNGYFEKGLNVFVFANPCYALAPAPESFDPQKIAALFDDQDYVPLMLKYEDWSGSDIRGLFWEVGHTKESFVVMYVPGKAPVRLSPFSLKPFQVKYNVPRL